MLESPRKGRAVAPATLLTALTVTLLTLAAAPPASAETIPAYDEIRLTVSPASVEVGDTVTVTVDADGLVDAYAYELSIDYDTSLLEFVADSAVLPSGGFGSAETDGGAVDVMATRLGSSPGLTGAQTLVSVQFTALAPGSASIALAEAELVDSDSVATPVDTSSPAFTTSVTIADDEDASDTASDVTAAGSADGAADGETGGGTGSEGAGGGQTGDGDLATTGADGAAWLIAGAGAVALIGAGIVLALRRRRIAR